MLPRSAPQMWGQQQPHAGCHRSTLPCRLLQSDQSSSHWARITPGIFITLYIYISLTAGERLSFPLPLQSRPRLIPHFEGLALSEGKARKEDSAAEHRRQRRASPGSHCTQQAAPRGEEGALLLPHTAKPPSSAHWNGSEGLKCWCPVMPAVLCAVSIPHCARTPSSPSDSINLCLHPALQTETPPSSARRDARPSGNPGPL